MSTREHHQAPVVKFLGEEAGRGGPFALLGLGHDIQSDDQIRQAAMRRLRQIDCHPQRATPDAQEARLAVHSASSQLLDPTLREYLIRTWPQGTPIDLPKAWKSGKTLQRITPALVRRARLLVGASGGWNSTARRRLAHLARLHRISALEIVQQFGSMPKSREAKQAQENEQPLPQLPPGPNRSLAWVAAYGVLGVLASAVFVTVFVQPLRHSDVQAHQMDSFIPNDVPLSTDPGVITAERDRLTHYTAIAHELDRLVARVRTEPDEARERFRVVYPQFTSGWVDFPAPALKRAGINIAEFITRLERDDVASEEIAPLLAVASLDPRRVMIASSVIDLTLGSPTLGVDTRAQLRAIRSQMSTVPIDPRVDLHSSLISVASGLAQHHENDSTDWWAAWLEGVSVMSQDVQRIESQLLLDALSSRLRDSQPPDEQWVETSKLFVRALSWRDQSLERYWLIAQFGESEVRTDRLAILTDSLANASAADGVDQLMVLAQTANAPQRDQMRSLYQSRWFPDQSSPGQSQAKQTGHPILDGIKVQANAVGDRLSDDDALDAMVILTRLTSAALLELDGHAPLATEVMAMEFQQSAPSAEGLGLTSSVEDDQWALLAVNAGNAAEARPILDRLLANESVGISGAYALVRVSLHNDAELRSLALHHVSRYSTKLPVLLAVDHAIMTRTSSARLEDLVEVIISEHLPSRTSVRWKPAVRRLLIERMARAIGETQYRQFSEAQRFLESAHAYHVTREQELEAHELLNHVANQRLRMISEFAGLSSSMRNRIEQAQSRAMILRARSASPMQRYLAEQQLLLDILVIHSELDYPDSVRSLGKIQDDYTNRLSGCSSVFQQIAQTERAIALVLKLALERRAIP